MQNTNTWKLNRNRLCAPPLPFMHGFKLSPAWATNPSAVCAAAYSPMCRGGLWNRAWGPGSCLWQPRWGNCQPRESHKVTWTAGSLTCSLLHQAPRQLCGCPIPGSTQGQAGWGPGQLEPMGGMGVGAQWSLKFLLTQAILCFYDNLCRAASE